jgi:hypothetical protein
MNILDKLLLNYFEEVESINNGKGVMAIKIRGIDDKPLKDFLSDVLLYQYNVSEWEDVFNTVTINLRNVFKQL